MPLEGHEPAAAAQQDIITFWHLAENRSPTEFSPKDHKQGMGLSVYYEDGSLCNARSYGINAQFRWDQIGGFMIDDVVNME